MDMLKSRQSQLCMWLSDDPDYILEQCEDMLSMKEFRDIQKQSSDLEKMRLLLKITIEKGRDTCQSFSDILRQHQAHYQQLQQLFSSNAQGSQAPTVEADSSSVVSTREITNITGKSLSLKIETVSGAGSSPSGNIVGQGTRAGYSACGGSVICADKISGVTIDGDIDLSVSVKPSQVRADAVEKTPPSSQAPAAKMIKKHKVELIDCLSADHSFILQHVQARDIVTDREYNHLRHISQPREVVTKLIDIVMGKDQKSIEDFIDLLKESDILCTYPQLEEITRNWC
ncbi:uncharacterized protein si:dkey-10c21.1 [Seriola aureovittata]|uniref:uncharacterized protein si:dkey-10c21.1 n=1 Tax=Seriola aureovittata TaxID=2871759 RepID=UPI0024BEC4D0|nr:uncharacterized protein si:dkey-10c21.1 [Seriola aureovittata]